MCYEDMQLGMRRWSRTTIFATNGSIPADGQRVLVRAATNAAVGSGFMSQILLESLISGKLVIVINPNLPEEQITLEQHGTLVQQQLFISPGSAGCAVTEIFDPDINSTPTLPDNPVRANPVWER